MGRFYAVKKGRKIGIFNSWEECQEQTHRYSNAEFQSFSSKQAAMDFLGKDYKDGLPEKNDGDSILSIYVDGSYCKHKNLNGIGCVMVKNNKVFHTISKQTPGNYLWNVGAELESALTALCWAIDNQYKEVVINYDYLGIEKWANGSWKTNNPLTSNYARWMRELKQHIKMSFIKVKAHSGNEFNELADALAKQAIGK